MSSAASKNRPPRAAPAVAPSRQGVKAKYLNPKRTDKGLAAWGDTAYDEADEYDPDADRLLLEDRVPARRDSGV